MKDKIYESEDKMLESARDRDRKKKKNIPDKIEIWSVNDLT